MRLSETKGLHFSSLALLFRKTTTNKTKQNFSLVFDLYQSIDYEFELKKKRRKKNVILSYLNKN